jgi:hypothetical protein
VIALLRLAGLLDEAIAQLLTFPSTAYAQNRHLPIFDVPAFGVPLALLASGFVAGWRRRPDPLFLVAAAGLAFYGYAGLRPDGEHLLPVRAMAAIAAAGLLSRWEKQRLARGVAVIAFGGLALPGFAFQVSRAQAGLRASADGAAPAAARGLADFPTGLLEAARFLDAHSARDAPVFVGNRRHDRISLNHSLLYFLAQRRGTTRYYNLHPGLATTPEVQREIVRSLDAVDALVLWDAPLWDEPNASARSSGALDLDEAIRERYRPVADWGPFHGLVRRP